MVLDHLDNREVNCPPYTAATRSRNRLYLSPGIDGICLTKEAKRVPNYTMSMFYQNCWIDFLLM